MQWNSDNAGRISNGLTKYSYLSSSVPERAIYRRWMRGLMIIYGSLFLIGGVAAMANHFFGVPQDGELVARASTVTHQRTN